MLDIPPTQDSSGDSLYRWGLRKTASSPHAHVLQCQRRQRCTLVWNRCCWVSGHYATASSNSEAASILCPFGDAVSANSWCKRPYYYIATWSSELTVRPHSNIKEKGGVLMFDGVSVLCCLWTPCHAAVCKISRRRFGAWLFFRIVLSVVGGEEIPFLRQGQRAVRSHANAFVTTIEMVPTKVFFLPTGIASPYSGVFFLGTSRKEQWLLGESILHSSPKVGDLKWHHG